MKEREDGVGKEREELTVLLRKAVDEETKNSYFAQFNIGLKQKRRKKKLIDDLWQVSSARVVGPGGVSVSIAEGKETDDDDGGGGGSHHHTRSEDNGGRGISGDLDEASLAMVDHGDRCATVVLGTFAAGGKAIENSLLDIKRRERISSNVLFAFRASIESLQHVMGSDRQDLARDNAHLRRQLDQAQNRLQQVGVTTEGKARRRGYARTG